jgi:hypothetical protein
MAQFAGRAYVEMGVEGQAAFRRAFASMEAQIKKFSAQVQMVGRVGFGAMGSALGGIGRMLRSLTVQATALGAAVGVSFTVKNAIDQASTLEETLNKFRVIFGDSSDQMQAWGDQFAKQMGRSRSEVLQFMADSQALIVPLGLDPAVSQQMSKDLTRLAYDMGSFHKVTDIEAFNALQSALRGEADAIEKFGARVNEAAVSAELLKQGLNPKTATEAQKTMARYNLILVGTEKAQGDLARSSGSYANQQKALVAGWTDVATAIGTAFLPYATLAVNWLKELFNSFGLSATAADNSSRVFGMVGETMAYVTGPLDAAIRGFHALKAAMNFIVGMGASIINVFLDLFRVLANNPLTRGMFGEDAVQSLDKEAARIQARMVQVMETSKQAMFESFEKAVAPEDLGKNAIENFQRTMADMRATYEAEAAKKAAELQASENAKKLEALTIQKTAEQAQEVADDLRDAISDESLQGLATGVDAARQGRDEVTAAAQETTQQAVQLAQPQALEATSTAAFEKFRENAMNQQLVLERQQAAFLQKIAKALTNPAAAFVEFAL